MTEETETVTVAEPDETKVVASPSGIARSNRMFISLRALGECDEKGRVVFSRGYSAKKIIAKPNHPIESLILPLLIHLLEDCARYSEEVGDAAVEKDMENLKKYVARLKLTRKSPEERKRAS